MVSKGQLRSFKEKRLPIAENFLSETKSSRNEQKFEILTTCETGAKTLIISLLYFVKLNESHTCMLFYNIYFTGNWNYIVGFLSFKV